MQGSGYYQRDKTRRRTLYWTVREIIQRTLAFIPEHSFAAGNSSLNQRARMSFLHPARTYLYARWLCFWIAFFGRKDFSLCKYYLLLTFSPWHVYLILYYLLLRFGEINEMKWKWNEMTLLPLGGPNLFLCALVMVLNRVFRQERFNKFLWFLASLIKNCRTLRKCYLFSCRFKKVWDIGICLKPHFYKKSQ